MKNISYRGEDYKAVDNPSYAARCVNCVFHKTYSIFEKDNSSCRIKRDMVFHKSLGDKTHEQSRILAECNSGVKVFKNNKKFERRVLSCLG